MQHDSDSLQHCNNSTECVINIENPQMQSESLLDTRLTDEFKLPLSKTANGLGTEILT